MNALKKFIEYFVNRHLLTNLVFIVVFIGGIFAWNNTSKEELPDIEFDHTNITASYPGATAGEVEHFVTKPLEDQIKGLDGVYRVTSTSSAGGCNISVDFEQNYPDIDEALMEVRNAVLDVDLPDDVRDDPEVHVWKTTKMAIIDLTLIDTTRHLLDIESRKRLQQYAYTLEQQLLNLPEVNSVEKSGYLQEEIQIMVNPEKLNEFDIPFNTVMNEVKNNHVRQPAGTIETKNEPKVTLLSELDTVEKLNDLVVQGGFEGQVVKLKEVADIASAYKKNTSINKVNGHEAITLRIIKNSSYGILEALKAVKKQVGIFQKNNLEGTEIKLIPMDDESVDLKNRLSIVVANGSIGFAMILIMLFIFLDFRSGIWVAMGIPFTLCFAMICTAMMGYTINNITLAAVIIVLGMIVDDAIVVSENITRLRWEGMPSKKSAVEGTAFVFTPVIASILTTCIAFVPLFFFRARFGKMLQSIPPIIFFMLGASLFESLVILPGHMHLEIPGFKALGNKLRKKWTSSKRAHWFHRVEDGYGAILNRILPFKGIVFIVFILLLVFSGYIVKTKMKFVMFPREETRQISIAGEAAPEVDRYDTAILTKQVEDIIAPYTGKEVIGFRTQIARSRWGRAVEENKFRMTVEIVPKEKRKKSADQLIKEWEACFAELKDIKEIKATKSRWGHASGSPIEVIVQENDDKVRSEVAGRLSQSMEQHPALENIEIERPLENLEYKISLDREKIKRLSINPGDVSSTLRAALEGTIIYEIPRGDEEIDVRFTIVDQAKDDIEKILDIPVENAGDYLVPLRDIVTVEKSITPNSIERKNSKRVTTIFADIKKKSKLTPVEIAENLEKNVFPAILSEHITTLLNFEGEVKDTRESTGDFRSAIIMAVLLIYIVLVLLFNSLTKPIIIMLAIPFGIIGIVLAFWLHGKVLFGFFAAIGTVGLAGVVVNDSIIMIAKLTKDYDIAQGKKASNNQIASIAKTRLRAVILTTLTTVAGLLPTAYGFTGYDAMLAEMMLALAWGLLFGTLITLLLVPCAYSLGHDIRFISKKTLHCCAVLFFYSIMAGSSWAGENRQDVQYIGIEKFIKTAVRNDKTFEEILIDELSLKYLEALELPAGDLVLSVKRQHEYVLTEDRSGPELTVSLSKLFPYTGTTISAEYTTALAAGSDENESDFSATISQPIIANAFGKATNLMDKIAGIATEVARHQVTEAYEDYLASVITVYYNWYFAYENLKIGESSCQQNLKLLENIKKREASKIALPLDVNKIHIQALSKKEDLIELQEKYNSVLNIIKQAIRHNGGAVLEPVEPFNYKSKDILFKDGYEKFKKTSRTYKILDLMEEKSSLKVKKEADGLLPSANLLFEYTADGEGKDLDRAVSTVFAGISVDWPFPDRHGRADYEISKVNDRKTRLSNKNKYLQLETDLKNLFNQIEREKKLIAIAEEKIALAESILEDETKNYTYGKVSLNDFIDAVNRLDENRFSRILHLIQLKILTAEWLRMTDQLISKNDIDTIPK